MPREITSPTDAVKNFTVQNSAPSDFKDRLVKLIPSEIITAYITLQGIISTQTNKQLFTWIAFVSLLILTPFYLRKVSSVAKLGQLFFTTVAFAIWVMAAGGFHYLFPATAIFDNTFLGSFILMIYTLAIPFVYKG